MFHLNDQQQSCKTTPMFASRLRATLHKSGKPIAFGFRATNLRQLEIGVSVPAWGGFSGSIRPFDRLRATAGCHRCKSKYWG